MRASRRERKGVTLIEAAMALFLMAFMLSGVTMMLASYEQEQRLAEQEAVARLDRMTAQQNTAPVIRAWGSGGSIW